MRKLDIKEINRRAKCDPKGFIEEAEKKYADNVETAAKDLLERMHKSPIMLLSGPSGSGKTTTAERIKLTLKAHGVSTHTISMDNYFNTRTDDNTPLDEDGNEDLESPLCLDISLINAHLATLIKGGDIEVPKFDFASQSRLAEPSEVVKLHKDEIMIIEGIHALNENIIGQIGEHAVKMYVSVKTSITDEDNIIIRYYWTRLLRRAIRDYNFRGASLERTLTLWKNVRRGERKYIKPYKYRADISIDTYHDYEMCVLLPEMREQIKNCDKELFNMADAEGFAEHLDDFADIDKNLIPSYSLVREFLGESSLSY